MTTNASGGTYAEVEQKSGPFGLAGKTTHEVTTNADGSTYAETEQKSGPFGLGGSTTYEVSTKNFTAFCIFYSLLFLYSFIFQISKKCIMFY